MLTQEQIEHKKAYQKEYGARWRALHPEYNKKWRAKNPWIQRIEKLRAEISKEERKRAQQAVKHLFSLLQPYSSGNANK